MYKTNQDKGVTSMLDFLRAGIQEGVRPTLPQAILLYVEREYNPQHVEGVFNDLLDVACGNRIGNNCEECDLQICFAEFEKKWGKIS